MSIQLSAPVTFEGYSVGKNSTIKSGMKNLQ